MGELIELSIQETNMLRAQVGLPLIPMPDAERASVAAHINESKSCEPDSSSKSSRPNPRAETGQTLESKHASREDESATKAKSTRPPLTSHFSEKSSNPRVLFQYDDVDPDSWLGSLGVPRGLAQPSDGPKYGAQDSATDTAHTKVKHSTQKLAQLADGEILTLADAGVLDDSGDELFNETLTREEKLSQNKKANQKGEHPKLGKSSIIGGSDDEPNDCTSELAILEGTTILLASEKKEVPVTGTSPPGNITRFGSFLDSPERPNSTVVMKTIKKKPKSGSRKRPREEDAIDVTGPMITTRLDHDDEPEESFEKVLSRSRARKSKARKVLTAEEIAEEVKLHKRVDIVSEEVSGIVYDDTKDFLDTLCSLQAGSRLFTSNEADECTEKVSSEKELDSFASIPSQNKEQMAIEKESMQSVGNTTSGNTSTVIDQEDLEKQPSKEPNLNSLLSTLKYLRSRQSNFSSGVVKKSKADKELQKNAELAKIQINVEERLIRANMSQDSHFLQMKADDQEKIIEKQLNEILILKGIVSETKKGGKYARYSGPVDPLKNYNPQVSVEYKDARGNKLDKKQAWKELLHKYHGLVPKHKKEPATHRSTEERIIH